MATMNRNDLSKLSERMDRLEQKVAAIITHLNSAIQPRNHSTPFHHVPLTPPFKPNLPTTRAAPSYAHLNSVMPNHTQYMPHSIPVPLPHFNPASSFTPQVAAHLSPAPPFHHITRATVHPSPTTHLSPSAPLPISTPLPVTLLPHDTNHKDAPSKTFVQEAKAASDDPKSAQMESCEEMEIGCEDTPPKHTPAPQANRNNEEVSVEKFNNVVVKETNSQKSSLLAQYEEKVDFVLPPLTKHETSTKTILQDISKACYNVDSHEEILFIQRCTNSRSSFNQVWVNDVGTWYIWQANIRWIFDPGLRMNLGGMKEQMQESMIIHGCPSFHEQASKSHDCTTSGKRPHIVTHVF